MVIENAIPHLVPKGRLWRMTEKIWQEKILYLKTSYFDIIIHMSQETRQIVNSVAGYGLLAIGVFIMFLSFFQVYRVFTKQASIPEFFHFQGVKMDLSKLAPQIDTSGFDALTKQLGVAGNISMQTPQPNETEIIPADMLNSSANIAVFAVLMGFVVNFGAKLATIGVELVRVVTMKPPNPV